MKSISTASTVSSVSSESLESQIENISQKSVQNEEQGTSSDEEVLGLKHRKLPVFNPEPVIIPHTEPEAASDESNPLNWPLDLSLVGRCIFNRNLKRYFNGFLYIKHVFNAAGVSVKMDSDAIVESFDEIHGEEWRKYWVELIGNDLHLYSIDLELASLTYRPSPFFEQLMALEFNIPKNLVDLIKNEKKPILLSLKNAIIEPFSASFNPSSSSSAFPRPPRPYTHFFGINSSGANLFTFATLSDIKRESWLSAIYLSIYESQRIAHLYTLKMLSRPRYFSLWQNLRINPFETESFNKDFSFSGDLQFKFSFSRNFSNYYAVLSNCIVEEQTPEDEIRANLPAQVFRQKQKKDSFIQSQNVKKLNKKILLYSSKSDHDKGHRPLYYIPVITSVSLSEPDINDPETISTALIQGVVIYTPKPISQVILKTIKRTTLLFEKPVDVKTPESAAPDLFGIPDLEDLYHQENVKTTPHPQSVLIKTDDVELCRWIIAISAIFKLDTDCDTIDNLIKEKCVGFKLENNETDDWGLLFLNLDQVSGTQIPFQRVSAEFPFCYSSIYKNFFDIVYREKVMAMIHGKLHNWNSSVEQNAITRRDLDRAAVSAKVKALIVWFHKLHDAIQEIDDSLLTSEFDFLHSNQEEFGSLCFFAIPSIDDGVVKWSFDNISEGDYYKKLELLFEHVNNLKDDVPDEIEEVADVEDVPISSSSNFKKVQAKVPINATENLDGQIRTDGAIVTFEETPEWFERNSLLSQVKAEKERLANTRKDYSGNDGPLLGKVVKDSKKNLDQGLLGEMGRVERERQQLKALGLYQALQYPGASGYLGRPQMPMMYPPPVLPNFPLQYPAQAQYPPQQQFYQPQYPGMAEQYNPYIPQTYAQPLFPQQFQQNPYQQYHPSQFSTAPDVYRNRQSLNSVSTESSDSVARRETLKEKFLAEERAKEMERKKERLDGGVYESRSFSFSTGTGSKAKEESGTESEDDIPIKTKPVSNESIFTKLLSKKKNDLVEEEDEVPLGKMKGIKKIVVPEPDSDDDMPLAALGLSRPAAKSIDSDDEPIGLKK